MAGIFDRVKPGEDRVSSHLLKAGMYLAVEGTFTDQQIITAINSKLETALGTAAQTDLATVRAAITAASTLQAKLNLFELFDALNIAVEMGVLTNEATYRSKLGIS